MRSRRQQAPRILTRCTLACLARGLPRATPSKNRRPGVHRPPRFLPASTPPADRCVTACPTARFVQDATLACASVRAKDDSDPSWSLEHGRRCWWDRLPSHRHRCLVWYFGYKMTSPGELDDGKSSWVLTSFHRVDSSGRAIANRQQLRRSTRATGRCGQGGRWASRTARHEAIWR